MTATPSSSAPARDVSPGDVLRRLAAHGTELCEAQVGMARAELARDVEAHVRRLRAVAIGLFLVICGAQLLVVALILALATWLGGWLASLLVSTVFLIAGAAVLKKGGPPVEKPFMKNTLEALKDDLEWLKALLR
ncbi:MAG: phage holin family protein [Thermoanaerobaculia bacterium]